MNIRTRLAALTAVLPVVTLTLTLHAQVPPLINYQQAEPTGSGRYLLAVVSQAHAANM